jgi:hypothetical protein
MRTTVTALVARAAGDGGINDDAVPGIKLYDIPSGFFDKG